MLKVGQLKPRKFIFTIIMLHAVSNDRINKIHTIVKFFTLICFNYHTQITIKTTDINTDYSCGSFFSIEGHTQW